MNYPTWQYKIDGESTIRFLDDEIRDPILTRKFWEIVTDDNEISNSMIVHGLRFWHHHRKQKNSNKLRNVYIFYDYEDYQIAKFLL